MKKKSKSNIESVKKQILEILSKGTTDMAAISEELNIQLPTVMGIVGRLMDEGHIKWAGVKQ